MNLLQKIFGKKRLRKIEIKQDLKKVLEDGGLSQEEILYFKIIRLEIHLKNAKNRLKNFLKPPKIVRKRK